jgi:hypothetical protein
MTIITSDGRRLNKIVTMCYNAEWDKFILHYVDGDTGQIPTKDIGRIEY